MKEDNDIDKESIENSQNSKEVSSAENNIGSYDLEKLPLSKDSENMEVHHHQHSHGKKNWRSYIWEFTMLFLAVSLGFFAENQREHYIENERMHRFLQSMQLDIESNRIVLDSALNENNKMIASYDTIVNLLESNSPSIDRAEFARQLGTVWLRGFINRDETFEQMKASGSLRYIGDFALLTAILDYQRRSNFAQYRTEHFEQKYYTELFLPTIYRNYDISCLHMLDSAYSNSPGFVAEQSKHQDILSGDEAKNFRKEMGSAFMLRLERMRVSNAAYRSAKIKGEELNKLISNEIE